MDTCLLVNTYLQESLNWGTIPLDNFMDSATRMRSNGGKARAKLSKDVLSAIGRKGGEARAAAMSPKARREAARRAVTVRWDRVRAVTAALALKQEKRKRRRVGASPRL